jgi:peptidyl-prolyl cis-trans isomerase D
MAKDDTPRRKKSSLSNAFVWIILVLLIGGLAGFGIGGFGGNTTSVGSVGSTEITVQQYQGALQQELAFESRLRGAPISPVQARDLGIDQRVLRNLAAQAALSEETKVARMSVGDGEVRRELQGVQAFQGPGGQFDREAYEFALHRNNLRSADFEAELRVTAARGILQQAITGGIVANDTYSETLYKFLAEERSFRWAPVSSDILISPNATPTDAALAEFHETNADQFMTPQIRKITYASLTPDMLIDTIEVDEARLRELYEERSDVFNQPARRLVERLSFPDLATAQAAKAQIDADTMTYDALVQERGLTLEDVDQGEVSREDLDADIAEAVFALTEPGVTDPVETSLGPALFRINAILEATSTPFEDVRDDLLQEVSSDQARRIIEAQIVDIDDLLVGGASLEDLAKETEMTLGQIDLSVDTADGIAGYDNFRSEASRVATDDFPEIKELSDGGIFALQLDEIVEPQLPALEDIKEDVRAAWEIAETDRRLAELGTDLVAQISAGTGMEAVGLMPVAQADMTRSDQVDGAPVNLLTEVFNLDEGGVALVQNAGQTVIVELTSIIPADLLGEEARGFLAQLNSQSAQAMAADVFEAFGQSIQSRHGLSINSSALGALHSAY